METSKKTSTEIVKNYMRYLKLERNFSVNTLEAYRHDLDYLLSYVAPTPTSWIDAEKCCKSGNLTSSTDILF